VDVLEGQGICKEAIMLRLRIGFSIAIFCTMLILSGETANATDSPALIVQITETIPQVRTGATVNIRTDAAQHIADLTRKIDPAAVDDKTLADLVSLLDASDDSVRFWVAGSLGNLGSRAKLAIPKLLAMLPKADCLNGAITSAEAIRFALMKMGATIPPPTKCTVRPIAG
jgi:hypothetical protein